jgi:hypothetical protein
VVSEGSMPMRCELVRPAYEVCEERVRPATVCAWLENYPKGEGWGRENMWDDRIGAM